MNLGIFVNKILFITSIVLALRAEIIHGDESNGNLMHHYQLSM